MRSSAPEGDIAALAQLPLHDSASSNLQNQVKYFLRNVFIECNTDNTF